MLNGIGGRTIAEAKARLTYNELMTWQAYRAKRGSLNIGLRVEENVAMLSTLYASSKTVKKSDMPSFYDFALHFDEPEVELHDYMKQFTENK